MQTKEEIRKILLDTLKEFWGYDAFREGQEELIFSILNGKDTLALLPTGGGKSLCYQLPALVSEGLCLVVSPLLALMKDQVFQLKGKDIDAEYISSELDEEEQENIYNRAINGEIKLLYISPERLSNSLFLEKIKDIAVSFIAIDEAHCISEWGQDFRPSYQNIKEFREVLGKFPCLALTATATPKVVADIREKLGLQEPYIFQKSYKRENLEIFTQKVSDKYQRIFDFLKSNRQSGIIYVRTRRDAEDLVEFLKRKNIDNVDFYHAGLSSAEKNERQNLWQKLDDYVLVSTNAFGMGIDKDNVRFVVHFSPSPSLENYYQEIGRAGRDGAMSRVFLLWNEQEFLDIDDILQNQIPSKREFTQTISFLYSIFEVGEGELFEKSFNLNWLKLQNLAKISRAKIKNIINFLHNQEIIYWNNFQSPSVIELKINVEDLDTINPKDAYFVEFLLRNISGVGSYKAKFNEYVLQQKYGANYQDFKDKILDLEKKGYLEYIDGNQDSITFLKNRNSREIEGKYWNLFEKIQKNKLQKWEEMKYFVKDTNFCKMKMILAYFGEKKSENCGKCNVCKSEKESNFVGLEKEILTILQKNPATIDELSIALYQYDKEKVMDSVKVLLNLNKIKMLNYKTYIING